MDAYFPVIDPIGFFVFTFGPGLLFWTLMGILEMVILQPGYLFSWDDVPGDDSGRLLKFLEKDIGIEWAKNAKIKKSNNDKTITITKGTNTLPLKLNKKENKVILKIGGGETHEYILKEEDGKLNIYPPGPWPMKIYKEFSVLYNKVLDKAVLISFTGIALNAIALILTHISSYMPEGLDTDILLSIVALKDWRLITSDTDILLWIALPAFIIALIIRVFQNFYKSNKQSLGLNKIPNFLVIFLPTTWLLLLFLSILHDLRCVFSNTIYDPPLMGIVSFSIAVISSLFFSVFYPDKLSASIAKIIKLLRPIEIKYLIIPVSIMAGIFVILISISLFTPTSTIYSLQTSPVHSDVVLIDCNTSTISSKLVLSNSLDRDVKITAITGLDEDLNLTDETLGEKGILVLNIDLRRNDLLNFTRPIPLKHFYYIHLKTTEGTIPIQIEMCEYLFSWDDVPGNDSMRLLKFLKNNPKLEWVENAEIKKIDNNTTINITKGKNSLSFKLKEGEEKVILEIDGEIIHEYILKEENGKRNIYPK